MDVYIERMHVHTKYTTEGRKYKVSIKKRAALFLSSSFLSILITVSSAKPSGVSECMEAISTLRGRSQMPLINSWRLIHSDCEEVWVISLWPLHAI